MAKKKKSIKPKKDSKKPVATMQKAKKVKKPRGPKAIILKMVVLIAIVTGIVKYYDYSGIFEPDQRNNHTQKKWDALYDFTKTNDVDVVLVGNSHMYNGINPKTLSSAANCNNFILASPGTRISDTYYCLKEAFAVNKPKLAIVETYGIKNFDQKNLKPVALSDQLKSFAARKNIIQKIASMPYLFNSDQFLIAWSNTIRNHSFLLSDREQIATNKILRKQKAPKEKELYLGRFIAYQKGIQQEVLERYKNEGSPVDGSEYEYSEIADKYVQAIADLCKENDVELLFLTLPMYKDHVENYDLWKAELDKIISKTGAPWFDMQVQPHYAGFNTTSFQDTYKANQHLTYAGSVLASYKLKDYLLENYGDILPDRSTDKAWHDLFYNGEQYFDSHPVRAGDKDHQILLTNAQVNNIIVDRIVDIKEKKSRKIIAKIDNSKYTVDWSKYKLRILLNYTEKGESKKSYIDLIHNKYQNSNTHALFTIRVQNIELVSIESIQFINA